MGAKRPALERRIVEPWASVATFDVAPSGAMVAGENGGFGVCAWDPNGKLVFCRDVAPGGKGRKYYFEVVVRFVKGAILALQGHGKTLYVLDPATGKERGKHAIGEDGRNFALTPDEKLLVMRQSTETTLYAFPSFEQVAHFDQYCNGDSIAISSDGRWLAVCGHEVHVFDLKKRKHTTTFEPEESPWAMAFIPGTTHLVTADDKRMLRVHDVALGCSLLREAGPNRAPAYTALAASPDGRLLAAANDRGTVVVHDAKTLDVELELKGHDPTIPDTGATSISDVGFDAQGRVIVSAAPKKQPTGLSIWTL